MIPSKILLSFFLFGIVSTSSIILGQESEIINVNMYISHSDSLPILSYVDFEDVAAIDTQPINSLNEIPDDFSVLYYGFFEMSAKEEARQMYLELNNNKRKLEYLARLGAEYPLNLSVDSKVDFIIGLKGYKEYIIVDSNNDEDLKNDQILEWEDVRIDGQLIENRYIVETNIKFDYWDRGKIKTGSIPIEMFKFVAYRNGRDVYKGVLKEYRIGYLEIGDRSVPIALMVNDHATYDVIDFLSLYIDIDENGKFDSWESVRPGNGPFTLFGETFELIYASTDGKTIIFKKHKGNIEYDLSLIEKGKIVPDFNLEKLNGEIISLEDFKGQLVLLDFWGIWCGPCLSEMPQLSKTYHKFKEKGFTIIGVLREADKKLKESYEKLLSAKKDITWAQVYSDELINYFNISGYPRYILLSKDGKILNIETDKLRSNLSGIIESSLSMDL